MWTQIAFIVMGILIGSFCSFLFFLREDRKCAKYAEEIVKSPENWCQDGCSYYKYADEHFEDPDDMWQWLDCYHCSRDCPVIQAQMILFDQQYNKKKKVKK